MKNKTPNNTTCFRRLKAGLIMAALLPATAGLLQAQTTSAYTNLTANLQWGNGIIYTRLSGSQGIIYQNANAAPLVEYRYNTMSNYLNGNTEIAGGAVVEINGDYQFGNATNAVIVHDGGTLTSRSSDNSGNLTIPAWRKILLDAPSQYATFGTYSTYRMTFLDPIGEITAGSGFQMAKIATSSTYSAGPLVFAATNTYTGPTVLSYGSLTLSNQFACMNSTLTPNTGGTVLFDKGIAANAFTVGGLAGNGYLVLSNTTSPGVPITLTVGGNHASATYFGRLPGIASGGTLVKVGAGTLTPSGTADNSYVALNVSNGVVVLGKTSTGSVHAIGGGITLNGGTVQLNGVGIDQINNASLVTLNSRDYILPKILQGNSGIMRFTKRAADFYPQIASRGFALFRIR